MKYGGAYWNIKEILPYQRNFNFINCIRNNGKTYTTLGFFIDRYLSRREQFIYILRTVDEKKKNGFSKAFEKVIAKEFPEHKFEFSTDTLMLEGDVVGHCRALSEAIKVKKESFPFVRWGVMDEYMLEQKHWDSYVKGWSEPDLLLNLYHTIDREEDRVTFFLLGNNTAFYNPYHLHPAFMIPPVQPGQIWYNKNVLFQWVVPTEEKKQMQEECKFVQMIKGTSYSQYAIEGNYLGDNDDFVEERPNDAVLTMYFRLHGENFAVWNSYKMGIAYITKHNGGMIRKYTFAITKEDISPSCRILARDNAFYKWLKRMLLNGKIYYEDMEVKLKVQIELYKIM